VSNIFITGGTGYLGRHLIPELLSRGHQVRALVRAGSEGKLASGCIPVPGNALQAESYAPNVRPSDTLVQLVGVPKPSPRKAQQFRDIDYKSGMAAVAAAGRAGVRHLVYVSVAHPAPVMQAYIQPRVDVEEAIRGSGLNATILRPWYVLGPGHRWPYLTLPGYWIMGLIPSKRDSAERLGLVTLRQMTAALVHAIEHPPQGVVIVEVPEIRRQHLSTIVRPPHPQTEEPLIQ
jgi:uncharacterized protein YbjT (DUF2867 family)